jgi:hypothetical protein
MHADPKDFSKGGEEYASEESQEKEEVMNQF